MLFNLRIFDEKKLQEVFNEQCFVTQGRGLSQS